MRATPKSPVHSRQNFKTKLFASSGGHLDESSFLFGRFHDRIFVVQFHGWDFTVSLGPSGFFFRLEEGNYTAKQRRSSGEAAAKRREEKTGFYFSRLSSLHLPASRKKNKNVKQQAKE